ncbi:interferon regulatory factor 7 isoform X3 [Bos taurus]|uniref:interferon regulatory factor 7 isoform X3 n=1 Tax=Bos taurus TaxID=9913 RepID=UPI0028CB293E|nr:interferon regulatory factor 7 isoform X3 [Bos taurus]
MAGDPWRRDEGKVSDSRRPMAGAGGPLRLREWLVAQIESGRYAGLRWEDAGKTLFRIPWKHAAKQGYQVRQDAALFRAWAIYKGKYLEGIDKEDPSTWKTRLRCALNKSADFCEVPERSQLDISNPYKVYRLLSDGAHDPVTRACAPGKEEGILQSQQKPPGGVTEPACRTEEQDGSGLVTEDKDKEQPSRLAQQNFLLPSPLADHSYQAQNPVHPWSPLPSEDFSNPELRAHLQDGCPEPEYQIRLCFGEEYPGPPDQPEERLIMAHVSHFPLHRRTTPHPAPLNSLSLLPPVPALPLTCHMTSDLEDLLCENARGNGLSLPAPQQSGWVRRRLAHSSTSLPPRRWSQSSPGSSSCTRRSTARCPGGRFPA